jgi:hypothetical protein
MQSDYFVVFDRSKGSRPLIVTPKPFPRHPYIACREQMLRLLRLLQLNSLPRAVYQLSTDLASAQLVFVHAHADQWPAKLPIPKTYRASLQSQVVKPNSWTLPGSPVDRPTCWSQDKWHGMMPELDTEHFIPVLNAKASS